MRGIVLVFSLFVLVFSGPVWAAEMYVCPMHPHIHGEKGDRCPICGMELVPLKEKDSSAAPAASTEAMPSDIVIEPRYLQALGVRTGFAEKKRFGRTIRAFGEVGANTRTETRITVRTDGWIVDLAASAMGDTVKKGDLLFTYYSPDLMNAQSDYLIGRRGGVAVGKPEARLKLYGMDDKAISAFKQKGDVMEATPFYAPADGAVSMIEARKGSFVGAGMTVLALQDYTDLWVNTDIPAKDMPFLKAGQPAKVIMPETGKVYETTVDFVQYIGDPITRTGHARLVIPYIEGGLRPGLFADVIIEANEQERLAVPSEAVLYDSAGAMVFESLGGGSFRPLRVEAGLRNGVYTEILSGLKAGQEVVLSGQFLIDAESNLRGGTARMGGGHEGHGSGGGHSSSASSEGASKESGQGGHNAH